MYRKFIKCDSINCGNENQLGSSTRTLFNAEEEESETQRVNKSLCCLVLGVLLESSEKKQMAGLVSEKRGKKFREVFCELSLQLATFFKN